MARARCYSAYGRLAYAPIAGWLRSEPLSAACSQLAPAQLAELARVLPEILAQHPSIQRPHPLTESWERRHFYAALNAAFGKARGPLLLLIDDLQWCDPDSFEWLHSLFRSDSASRILVVGTVRPEETGRTHPLAGLLSDLRQTGQVVELPLSPLTAEETAALAAQVANRPLDAADSSALYRATKGNPLFVVESVRAGLRDPMRGRRRLGAGTAPPRIHAVITARLAQLSAQAYELAGLASAFGQSFSLDLLAKASDWDDDSLSAALDELWQRRIIEGQGEAHGVAQYDFTHDRLREVTYAELSPVRRRFLHRRIAIALEELHPANPESVSGQLAAHYEAAGVAEPAIHHYVEAAEVARHRYADAEAAGPAAPRPGALPQLSGDRPARSAGAGTAGHAWPRAGDHAGLQHAGGRRTLRARPAARAAAGRHGARVSGIERRLGVPCGPRPTGGLSRIGAGMPGPGKRSGALRGSPSWDTSFWAVAIFTWAGWIVRKAIWTRR